VNAALPPVVTWDRLGALGTAVSTNNGQSVAITPLAARPQMLLKQYRADLTTEETARLDQLVAMPGQFDTADRLLLLSSTSWPIARVVRDDRTVGCLIPKAPAKFFARLGPRATRPVPLEVDWVSVSANRRAVVGLPALDLPMRLRICRNLLDVAAMFERHDLVYADWSYANAFWSPWDGAVFVIDVDSCAPGSRLAVKTPNFDDPVPRADSLADAATDRYAVALLVARCLTGEREYVAALAALDRLGAGGPLKLCELLRRTLTADDRAGRVPIDDLRLAAAPAVDAHPAHPAQPAPVGSSAPAGSPARVPGSGVIGWTTVAKPAPIPRRRRYELAAVAAAAALTLLLVWLIVLATA
jgi:hypothetical protein